MNDAVREPAETSETPESALILGQGPDGEVYVLSAPKGDGNDHVTEPAKVMRIGRMISRLLDEVKDAPLDDASQARLREIYDQSIDELASGLDEGLAKELHRIVRPFAGEATPSDAELRIAQAQLVGWLEGLFQGLQTALVAQHLNAQLHDGPHPPIPQTASDRSVAAPGTGMYL